MTDKPVRVKVTTPVGTLVWPNFDPTKPDKFNKFGTKLKLDADAYNELMSQVQDDFDAAVAEGEEKFKALSPAARKKLKELTINEIGTPEYDKETEEETGFYLVSFMKKCGGESKKTGKTWQARPIPVYDAAGKPLSPSQTEKVWSGSTAKVAFSYFQDGYFVPGTGACGLSLEIEAVQVIDLAGPGQRSASSYGFGVEDGFSVEDLGGAQASAANDNSEASDDDTPGAADF